LVLATHPAGAAVSLTLQIYFRFGAINGHGRTLLPVRPGREWAEADIAPHSIYRLIFLTPALSGVSIGPLLVPAPVELGLLFGPLLVPAPVELGLLFGPLLVPAPVELGLLFEPSSVFPFFSEGFCLVTVVFGLCGVSMVLSKCFPVAVCLRRLLVDLSPFAKAAWGEAAMATAVETIKTAPSFLTSASLDFNICDQHNTIFTSKTSRLVPDANSIAKRPTQRLVI
jgi:hypothetical protein